MLERLVFWRKKPIGEIQTVESAMNIFDKAMSAIHAANDVIVSEQQKIIDGARAIQAQADSEVKKTENFKTNFAKLFEE